jgi:hypothetical protein
MDFFEKVGYALLALVAVAYLAALVAGMVWSGPVGLVGLLLILGIGVLLIKVIKERLGNREDDHYAERIDK